MNLYQYQKSDKAPFIIYADLEHIIEKNNPENSSTAKVREHVPSGFFNIYNIIIYKHRNNPDVYRDSNCMEKFCKVLREHAMMIVNFKEKKWSY